MGKQALGIVVDVSLPSTEGEDGDSESNDDSYHKACERILSGLLKKELKANRKTDETCVVLGGVKEGSSVTEGREESEDDFDNVVTLTRMDRVTVDFYKKCLDTCKNAFSNRKSCCIEMKSNESCLSDAISSAIDLIKHRTLKKKYTRRLIVVLNVANSINIPEIVKDNLENAKELDVLIEFVVPDSFSVGYKLEGSFRFAEENNFNILDAAEYIEQFERPSGGPAGFNKYQGGHIELTSKVKFHVNVFSKIAVAKLPSLTKFSKNAEVDSDQVAKVARSQQYKSTQNPDVEVPPEERVAGYLYGKEVVPFTKEDEEAMGYHPPTAFQILFFAPQDNIDLKYLKSTVDCVVADPKMPNAKIAMSALVHAMKNKSTVAIARYVGRKKAKLSKLVRLSPYISDRLECLYMTEVACHHDVRDYQFASLDRSEKFRPSKTQVEAMKSFIKKFEFDDDSDAFVPETTSNPVHRRFFETVHERALNPDYKIPPVESPPFVPPQDFLKNAEDEINNLVALFPLQASSPTGKTKQFWGAFTDLDKEEGGSLLFTDEGATADEKEKGKGKSAGPQSWFNTDQKKVDSVGNVNPVDDFWAMVDRRDQDMFQKACDGIFEQINTFIGPLGGKQYFEKALNCLRALREGCLKNSNGDVFNNYLKRLKSMAIDEEEEEEEDGDFFALWKKHNLSLITSTEDISCETTEEESKAFLERAEIVPTKFQSATGNATDDDDLSDME